MRSVVHRILDIEEGVCIGDTEVVKRKLQPMMTINPPVLSGKQLQNILGASVPSMTDITGHESGMAYCSFHIGKVADFVRS